MVQKLRLVVFHNLIINGVYDDSATKSFMQKSRLGEKYNSVRHNKDPFYSNYMLKIFLSKLTRSGAGATGQRQIETALKIAKLSNFVFKHEYQNANIILQKKRSQGVLRKRSYL